MKDTRIFIKRKECELFDYIMSYFSGPLFVIDTETTGVHPKTDYIIQFSAIRLDRDINGQYRISGSFDQYIKPPIPVPEEASNVNHITNEFLADKPTEMEAFQIIREYMKDAEEGRGAVIGYNNKKFDDVIISCMYNRCAGVTLKPYATIDCKIMAEEIVRKKDLPDQSMKLCNVAGLYGVLQEGLHNAMTDIVVTGRLTFRIYEDYIDNFREVPGKIKPRIKISGMYRFKKSKIVNYIMITGSVLTEEGYVQTGKVRYDVWNKCYQHEEGALFDYGDFNQFVEDANIYAGGDISKFK